MNRARWQQIDDLFDVALDLPAQERDEYLSAHCTDPEIRARVERLLDRAESTRSLLPSGGALNGTLGQEIAREIDQLEAIQQGELIGSYEVVGLIAEGGMGQVYRAVDPQLERHVAIKVLPEELAGDARRLQRFAREAKVLASLNHPNIASIYGLEDFERGPFLVLELVDG